MWGGKMKYKINFIFPLGIAITVTALWGIVINAPCTMPNWFLIFLVFFILIMLFLSIGFGVENVKIQM